jgi:hypothetical protein
MEQVLKQLKAKRTKSTKRELINEKEKERYTKCDMQNYRTHTEITKSQTN